MSDRPEDPAPESPLDRAVRTALEAGDVRRAVEQTLRELGPEVRGYLHATLRDPSAADEIAAQLGEQLLTSLPRWRRDSSVRTYVYAIARNLARADRRRAARERDRDGGRVSELDLPAAGPRTVTPLYQRTTLKDRLSAARARLTPDELDLIVLRVDRQMAWRDIGEILGTGGTPAETAVLRKRFERTVKRLREWLRDDA